MHCASYCMCSICVFALTAIHIQTAKNACIFVQCCVCTVRVLFILFALPAANLARQPLSAQCYERMAGMAVNSSLLAGDSYSRQEPSITMIQTVNGTNGPGTNASLRERGSSPTCLRGDDVFGSQPCLVILSLSILVAALLFLLVCVSIVQEGKVRKNIHTDISYLFSYILAREHQILKRKFET